MQNCKLRTLIAKLGLPLAIHLSSILLVSPTLASDALDEQIVLRQGISAPFEGVLVPEWMYREMQVDILKTQSLDYELAALIEETDSKPNLWLWTTGGFGVGILTGFLLNTYVSK